MNQRLAVNRSPFARRPVVVGKAHRPRRIRRAAKEFAVDEVGDTDEEDADRRGGARHIAKADDRNLAQPCGGENGNDRADQSAVERHAAFPHAQDEQRVAAEFMRLVGDGVEKNVADTAAEQDADHRVEREVVDVLLLQRAFGSIAPEASRGNDADRIPPAKQQAEDVAERVPAHRERPKMNGAKLHIRQGNGESGRIDAREGDFQGDVHEATLYPIRGVL